MCTEYSSDLEQGGLQIPCTLHFTGDKEKLAWLLKSNKQPYTAAVCTCKLEHNCEPVRKKIKIEQDAGDQECSRSSSSSSSSDVWVV